MTTVDMDDTLFDIWQELLIANACDWKEINLKENTHVSLLFEQ